MRDTGASEVIDTRIWRCPYCHKEIDEHGACCGEIGHAVLDEADLLLADLMTISYKGTLR